MNILDPNSPSHLYKLAIKACVVLVVLVGLSGCKQWPGAVQMRQNQLDNDRLLSEFRAQKKRADELQQRNDQLAKRLDESERLIAKQNLPSNRTSMNEMSSRRSVPSTAGLSGPVPNTRPEDSLSKDPRSLEPPSASGSGIRASTASSRGNGDTPKWKPSRRSSTNNRLQDGN